mgnify:CR=1 FL=1
MSNGLRTCPNCGKPMKTDAEFCMFCGTKWTEFKKESSISSDAILCVSCGRRIPAGSAYCAFCGADQSKREHGKTDSDKSTKKQYNKSIVIAASIGVIAALGIFIYGITYKSKSTYVADSQENREMNTVHFPAEADTETQVSDIQQETPFTYTNSQGYSFEVETGYSYVCCTKSMQSAVPHGATILIPPIFDYTSDEFVMGSEETNTNGFYNLSFKNERLVDFGFVADYVSDLEQYGFTLEGTMNVSDNHKVYYLNYYGDSGNITHGADERHNETYDMSIMAYKGYGTTYVIFKYPKEVWFDLEGTEDDNITAKVLTDYSLNEKNKFTIRGWGQSGSDYIVLSFDSGSYGTGSIITTSDFKAQAGAGESALCNVSIWGSTISGDGWPVDVDSFDSIDVNVLRCDDLCVAISYKISVPSGSAQYLLEGICVADAGKASSVIGGANSEPEQIYSGEEKCITCNGTGQEKCAVCRGSGLTDCPKCTNGRIQCSLCHGTGRTGNSYGVGGTSTCTSCHGTGYKDCTCLQGWLQCTSCHGNGYKDCIMCNGTGKR